MRNKTVRRSVVAGLGAAAGALAAAAFVSTAPIADADDGSGANSVDYAGLAAPAATYPLLEYTGQYDIYLGNTEYEYSTDYTGSGMPTTTETTVNLGSGITEYGTASSYSGDYATSATTGYDFSGGSELIDGTSASGSFDYFEPFLSTFSSF
jgi:hypothetical protein